MHFEGPQNTNQMRTPFMVKKGSLFILSSKGVKHYNIILNIDQNHSAETARLPPYATGAS